MGTWSRGKRPAIERFWEKVDIKEPSDCWLWIGGLNEKGYGCFFPNAHQWTKAHKYIYEILYGEVPQGLELDHLCRNRRCVNPFHLEPVTHKVNMNRGVVGVATGIRQRSKTHCPQGHIYDEENTYVHTHRGYTRRTCKICRNIREAQRRLNKRHSNGD